MTKEDLRAALASQHEKKHTANKELERFFSKPFEPLTSSHALIVTGIRRCGKSTLLCQERKRSYPHSLYLNFEDPRLFTFTLQDFVLLDEIIADDSAKTLFFDEIQVVPGWELYVRQKLDEGFQVAITGSNASLLSTELGTKLTGRHLDRELFPFSYSEFLTFYAQNPQLMPTATEFLASAGVESFESYLALGGFPEYLKQNNTEILTRLLDDILMRDIAVRYGVRDVAALKRLALFLLSNTANLVSANRLTQALGIKTAATVLEYFSYLEQSYLVSFVPKFDYSWRVQSVNPKKVYAIDTALVQAVSIKSNKDNGFLLETSMFQFLRQKYAHIWYYNDKEGECDFVVSNTQRPQAAIQVCWEINHENREREQRGLFNAMKNLDIQQGFIVTLRQKDSYFEDEQRIDILPAWEFFTQ